ncbi:alpha/beta fold hydrolase [Clostridium celatum]|uniref:Proline-specific peptidase n=1 Tax=Clostridium celatum DSM 1785 TaxID=545697 RepID=L1Q667_9CLOT|nr:alpha/beta hydrolase [Clostridium celatum]EKY23215.1 proline-specific peptidase [Clostridium celatum DSM 1785]MCE9655534.1 alpha/beta hydrolase [Clostridium celatum]MDU6296097.1 alpha/beta hydrolase [Clostridium celatum]
MGYYISVESKIKVYVEDINENGNKTIIFLHGWPGSHELFEYQYDYLIQKGIRCIALDQRGFGKSDRPTCGYDYDTLSDDVKAVVDQLELSNFTLLGHSTGGAIAIRYMARHKGKGVDKLILCGAAAPSLIKRSYFPYGLRREAVEEIIKGTYNDRPKMLKDFGDTFFYKRHSKWFMEWFLQLGFQAASWATAEVANTWLNEEKLFEDIKEIDVPTLIIHGIHDQVCLFSLAEAQKNLINDSKLVKFKNSGHGVFYDEKDKFNEVMLSFIEE